MRNLKVFTIAVLLFPLAFFVISEEKSSARATTDEHEDHSGHDHAEHKEKKVSHDKGEEKHDDHDDHDGHDNEKNKSDEVDHDDHDGHDHEKGEGAKESDHEDHAEKKEDHSGHDHGDEDEEEGVIELTVEQKKDIGLTIKTAGPGNLRKELTLTGEVVLNEDNVIHLVPRVSGIATKVHVTLSDKVRKGDPLVTLDSAELGEAKSDYYEKFNETNCCMIELVQARTIEKNTKHLLSVLKGIPSLDELRETEYGDMGEYRSKLLASYADFLTNKMNFERQEKLFKLKVVSKKLFEDERNTFEKVKALFFSKVHSARFKIMQNLFEAERAQRVNEFKLKTAERKLRLLGLAMKKIKELQVTQAPTHNLKTSKCAGDCGDPKCAEKSNGEEGADGEEEEEFSKITITAPESGTIIKRHLARGEKVSTEEEIFTIADLSTVWVILQVPARDISLIKKNTEVIVESPYGLKAAGKVKLLSPTLSAATRTAKALIVLDNPREEWKPGSFIIGRVLLDAKNLKLVIPRRAVQNIEGKEVVFVVDEHGFKPVFVVLGRSDRTQVEILSGLKKGMRFVTRGAFELKAIMITSNMDSHAGHGH